MRCAEAHPTGHVAGNLGNVTASAVPIVAYASGRTLVRLDSKWDDQFASKRLECGLNKGRYGGGQGRKSCLRRIFLAGGRDCKCVKKAENS